MSMSWQPLYDFWFANPAASQTYFSDRLKLWFGKSDTVDEEVRERFLPLLDHYCRGELDTWTHSSNGLLSLVVLLDQVPRNSYRNDPRAYAFDAHARKWAELAIEKGWDREVSIGTQVFFYMPLEHSEDLADQRRCVSLFENLAKAFPHELKDVGKTFYDYAVRHLQVIAQHGRFPHRNVALARPSTSEELTFLKQPNSSF